MEAWNSIKREELPPSMQDMSMMIGLEATIKLIMIYGGQKIYIPQKAKAAHPLVRAIGQDATEILSAEFGGLAYMVPLATRARSLARNRVIREKRQQKYSGAKLAQEFNLSQRQIWEILQGERNAA